MIMFGLALRSLRHRAGAFTASLIGIFLGSTILMAFASLLDASRAAGVSTTDETSLSTIATVVGGWGLVIVAFGVGSTFQLAIGQRASEIALLKATGATPRQVTRMVVGEGLLVAVVGSALAIVPGLLAGRGVLAALISTDQIAPTVDYTAGAATFGMGLGVTLAAAVLASLVTARRAAATVTRQALQSAAAEEQRISRKRIVFGVLLILAGIGCAALAATTLKDDGYTTLSVAGEACIWSSIGLALLAPLLLRSLGTLVSLPIRGVSGVSGYLAHLNTRQRSAQLAGMLMPVILLTGLATGTLYMQKIHDAANPVTSSAGAADDKGVQTLNVVVLSMIVVFAAVILVNNSIATMIHRRREFGQLRLTGAAPGQLRGMVAAESAIAIVAGLLMGTLAALIGVIPYSLSATDRMLPQGVPWMYLGIVAMVTVLVLLSSLGAAARAIRTPALEALGR